VVTVSFPGREGGKVAETTLTVVFDARRYQVVRLHLSNMPRDPKRRFNMMTT